MKIASLGTGGKPEHMPITQQENLFTRVVMRGLLAARTFRKRCAGPERASRSALRGGVTSPEGGYWWRDYRTGPAGIARSGFLVAAGFGERVNRMARERGEEAVARLWAKWLKMRSLAKCRHSRQGLPTTGESSSISSSCPLFLRALFGEKAQGIARGDRPHVAAALFLCGVPACRRDLHFTTLCRGLKFR